MKFNHSTNITSRKRRLLTLAIAAVVSGQAIAQEGLSDGELEEITVTARAQLLGFGESHANNTIDLETIQSQSPTSDVLNFINRLPGVNVTQGDAIGGNDWSTRIYIRGMSNSTDTAQIGYMIDGMPNGDSVYGGGQKPNRYVDSENVAQVNVGQNASDIGSASNAALGGTVRYYTDDPDQEFGAQASFTAGEFEQQRGFLRVDSGEILPGLTSYISYSESSVRSWIGDHSGDFDRQHVDVKVVKDFDSGLVVKAKGSYNYRNENDYNSVSLAQFKQDPDNDGLLDDFDIETVGGYRPTWGGTRWDRAFSLEISQDLENGGKFTLTPYYHNQQGYGWWAPPYRVATLDGSVEGGQGPNEYYTGTFSRDASGALIAAPGTDVSGISCLAGRYAGNQVDFALDPAFDCNTAERIATRRRSGYENDRFGITGETELVFGQHTLTLGGWFEYQDRDNDRRWFDLDVDAPGTIDPENSDLHWVHYDRNYETRTLRFYAQDKIQFDRFDVTAGLVFHKVDTDYTARIEGVERSQTRDELLPKLGGVYRLNDTSEIFASYSRNIRMLGEDLLAAGVTDELEPELSDNVDIGYRWNGDRIGLVAQIFVQRFKDRLGSVDVATAGGDQFLQGAIQVLNVGGIDTQGFELAVSYDMSEDVSLYGSYSFLDSEYTDDVPGDGIKSGNALINVPENQLFGEVIWRPQVMGLPLQLGMNVKFVGEREGDLANSETLDSYTLVGVHAKYTLENVAAVERVTFQLNGSNVTDEQYLAAPDGDQGGAYFIGAPSTFSFSVKADF